MKHRFVLATTAATLILSACGSNEARDAAPAPPATPTFNSDRISVTTRGQGPDIVLIHGLGAHRDVWSASADQLDDRYRLHLVQINGFAGAAPGANAAGPVSAPVADEIARYIRENRLERPALVGHSMGGSIAMMAAARHSDIAGRVMVVDMVPFMGLLFGPPGTTAENIRPRADAFREELLTKEGMLDQMIPTMTRKEEARPLLSTYARDSNRQTIANAFHELFVADLRPELGRITVPMTVLYVVPQEAPMPPAQFESALRQMYSTAPRVNLVRIDDSNHYIQIDQPARFVTEVDAFMKR
jgi:pimeloyl-ACP methyl ester carboxylesterase